MGAVTGILTGLIASVVLVILSPNVMNSVGGWIHAQAIFPLKNLGIVSIPLGLLDAYVGTKCSKKKKGRISRTNTIDCCFRPIQEF